MQDRKVSSEKVSSENSIWNDSNLYFAWIWKC